MNQHLVYLNYETKNDIIVIKKIEERDFTEENFKDLNMFITFLIDIRT